MSSFDCELSELTFEADDSKERRLKWVNSCIALSADLIGREILLDIPLRVQQYVHMFHAMLVNIQTQPSTEGSVFSFKFLNAEHSYTFQLTKTDISVPIAANIVKSLQYYVDLFKSLFGDVVCKVESNKLTMRYKNIDYFLCVVA